MARSYTITQDGESRSYTIEDGIGPAGSDANVTNANVNAAIEDDPSATRLALEIPIDNFVATTAPTNNDDSGDGYSVGSKWYDSVAQEAYLCVDSTLGSAVWILTTLTADDLGTAAFTDSTDYATAAQGGLADTAVQPAEFSSPPPIGDLTPNSGDFTTLSASGTATLPHIHGSIAGNLYIHVRNTTGGVLSRGTPIYIVGNVGDTDRVQVAAADNTNSAKMPAVGLLEESLDNNGDGNAIIVGELPAANTNAYSINQELYVGVGALTGTKPTTGEVQSVGAVARVNTNTGVIVVNMQGRRTPDEAFATAAQGTDERVPTAAGLTSKFSTNKATIVDGDKVAIFDSAASDVPKHGLFSLIKSTIKTYFDTLYVALTGNQTIAGNKTFSGDALFTSSTRPISSGTGIPAENSLTRLSDIPFNSLPTLKWTIPIQIAGGSGVSFTGTGSGANQSSFANNIELFSGSTAGNYATLRCGERISMNIGGDRDTVNFNQKFIIHASVRVTSLGAGSIGRAIFAAESSYVTGSPTTKYIGFKITHTSIIGEAYDGSTLNTTSAATIGSFQWHNICIYSDGNGLLSLYLNNALVGTTTAPTGTQVFSNCRFVLNTENGSGSGMYLTFSNIEILTWD
jgi:hypothetical protein